MGDVPVLYANEAKYDQAEPLFATVVTSRRRVLSEEHPATLSGMQTLGSVYTAEKKYTEAALVLTRVLRARQRVLGAEHTATLNTMDSLGRLNRCQRKYPEAEALYLRVLDLRRRVLGNAASRHDRDWGFTRWYSAGSVEVRRGRINRVATSWALSRR